MSETQTAGAAPIDPIALLRSRSYVVLLVLCAALGVPVAVVAYFVLQLTAYLQVWVYDDLPKALGFSGEPTWWPILPLLTAGIVVGLTVRFLPGRGGGSPVEGFHAGGTAPTPQELLGITLAGVASIGLGAIVGPEAPLIAIGAGLAAATVRLLNRGSPQQAVAVVAAAGSFAAISTLLGSPLLGAFLLMEAAGLAGPTLGIVLLPGLLSAGIGSLIFIGLDSLTGLGPVSLAIPDLPSFARPDGAEFAWALGIGVAAAVFGSAGRWLASTLKPHADLWPLFATPLLGLLVAAVAVGYAEGTGKSSADVLFSGERTLGPLLVNAAHYSAGALIMLVICKGIAYICSLAGFRGGPVFPAMYIGAAGGILLSHLPGLPVVAGAAMGIGAMCVAMLRLPLTSVLLATLLLQSDGLAVMPLVIVAVVVAHVVAARLDARVHVSKPIAASTVSTDKSHSSGRTPTSPSVR